MGSQNEVVNGLPWRGSPRYEDGHAPTLQPKATAKDWTMLLSIFMPNNSDLEWLMPSPEAISKDWMISNNLLSFSTFGDEKRIVSSANCKWFIVRLEFLMLKPSMMFVLIPFRNILLRQSTSYPPPRWIKKEKVGPLALDHEWLKFCPSDFHL